MSPFPLAAKPTAKAAAPNRVSSSWLPQMGRGGVSETGKTRGIYPLRRCSAITGILRVVFLWYHNLLAHPELTVEVGNETYDAIATPLTGEERDRIYARWAAMYPQYGEYQRHTTPKIPVIALQRRKG